MSAKRFTSILAVAVLWSACSREERTIGIGENIHHDDFEYSVLHVDKVGELSGRTADGLFYVVTFRVENRAGRVDHLWGNDIAYLLDENGRSYENDGDGQKRAAVLKEVEYRERHVTHAGEAETTLLVFDLPKGVSQPYLKVRGSLLMGDVFDLNQYARTRVRLF